MNFPARYIPKITMTRIRFLTKIRALDGIDKASYGTSFSACFTVAKEDCSKEFESFYSDYEQAYYSNTLPADDSYELTTLIYFVEDHLFEDYLKEIGENSSDYQNSDHPTGVLIDRLHVFNDKYYDINIFANPSSQDIVLSSLDEDVKIPAPSPLVLSVIQFLSVSVLLPIMRNLFFHIPIRMLSGRHSARTRIAHLEIHTI